MNLNDIIQILEKFIALLKNRQAGAIKLRNSFTDLKGNYQIILEEDQQSPYVPSEKKKRQFVILRQKPVTL